MASEPGTRSMELIALTPMRRPGVKPIQKPPDTPEPRLASVMAMFKLRTLNSTLFFVNMNWQLILRYDDLSVEQAEFVTELITKCKSQQTMDMESGSKSLYAPLADAFKSLEHKFDFTLITEESNKPDMRQLRLQKIPKNTINQNLNSTSSADSQPCKKKGRKARKTCRMLNSVTNVNDDFKRDSVRRIKEFLNDDAMESLHFLDVTEDQMSFIKEVKSISKRMEALSMCDVGVRMDLEVIRHCVARHTRMFMVKTKKEIDEGKRNLLMRKTPVVNKHDKRKDKNDNNNNNLDDENSDASTSPEPSNGLKAGEQNNSLQSETQNKTNMTIKKGKKTDDFMLQSLNKLKDFVSDSAQASLLFPKVTRVQMAFLEHACTGQSDTDRKYSLAIVEVMKEFHQLGEQCKMSFKVVTEKTNVDLKQDKQDITFIKVPIFAPLPKRSVNKGKKAPTAIKKTKSTTHDENKEPNTNASASKDKKMQKKMPDPAKKSLPAERGQPRVNQAMVNLMEGLNQPLVSEKGSKMMQMMGWEGGALGARGDGIKEPIKLSFMSGRTGLGHPSAQPAPAVAPPPQLVHSVYEGGVRRVFINTCFANKDHHALVWDILHDLITTQTKVCELTYIKPITMKVWGYIKHKIISINSKLIKELKAIKEHANLVRDIVQAVPGMEHVITACLGVGLKNVLFVKQTPLYQPPDKRQWSDIVNILPKVKPNKTRVLHPPETYLVDGDTFRVFVLTQTLQFCQMSVATEKHIHLRGAMTAKQTGHVEDLIRRLNVNSRCSSVSKIECDFFNEILLEKKGYKLDVQFPVSMDSTYKTILLRKVIVAKKKNDKYDDELVSLKNSGEAVINTNENGNNKIYDDDCGKKIGDQIAS